MGVRDFAERSKSDSRVGVLQGEEAASRTHLAQEADVEAEGLGIAGAGVHVVAHEEHQLQQADEAVAPPQLLAGQRHAHDVRPDVVHLLLQGQLEEDAIQAGAEHLHRAHLEQESKARISPMTGSGQRLRTLE